MGTNYYLHEKPACSTCGHEEEPLHIGKSSAGWCFSLHIIPEERLTTLDAWKARWSKPGASIADEYGDPVTPDEMLEVITARAWPETGYRFDYARNHAEPGPNGLARHSVGRHCVGHGEGTWDYIPGDFS